MAYDLEEQEQIDELKAWWKRYGNLVQSGLIVVLLAFGGFKGWQYYQQKQALEASNKFEQLSRTESKDLKAIQTISGQLMENYAGTPYAARAALIAAKANYAAKDSKSAIAQLEWARSHAKEAGVAAVAQLQLAAIQLDEKQYDAALGTLGKTYPAGYEGLFADLKGDVLVAQGKLTEAKAAYAEALLKLASDGRYRRFTERKLDALGS